VRQVLRWQATEYDGSIRRGTVSLTDIQPGETILFTSYALARFALLASSFFVTLLENYGLQLHHLTSHANVLVAIFIHLCEMYVGVRPSVRLFRFFFTLRASERSSNHLGPTNSSKGASLQPCTSPCSAPASGTNGGSTG
jgi:hypothetical protein